MNTEAIRRLNSIPSLPAFELRDITPEPITASLREKLTRLPRKLSNELLDKIIEHKFPKEYDKFAKHRNEDYSPLSSACIINNLDMIKELLKFGANIHTNDDEALRWASESGYHEVVKLLLAAEANVHADDDCALRSASGKGHQEIVKLLLVAGANVHAYDNEALEYASINGRKEIVKLLLAAGADVHIHNNSALKFASQNGHQEVVKLLLAAGADVHANNDKALKRASYYGYHEIVEILKHHLNFKDISTELK